MWTLLLGVGEAFECTRNKGIRTVTGRYTLTGGSIEIKLIQLSECVWGGNGAVIFVYGDISVLIRSCSFLNRSTRNINSSCWGGCAWLPNVKSGTSVIDSCATKCWNYGGSVVYFCSDADVMLKGSSVFDCASAFGAICDYIRAAAMRLTLTSLKGEWDSSPAFAAALCQDNFQNLIRPVPGA
jgi:hypothetical protein